MRERGNQERMIFLSLHVFLSNCLFFPSCLYLQIRERFTALALSVPMTLRRRRAKRASRSQRTMRPKWKRTTRTSKSISLSLCLSSFSCCMFSLCSIFDLFLKLISHSLSSLPSFSVSVLCLLFFFNYHILSLCPVSYLLLLLSHVSLFCRPDRGEAYATETLFFLSVSLLLSSFLSVLVLFPLLRTLLW